MSSADTIMAPMKGTEHREVAGVMLDTVQAGKARVRRAIYPVGFHWARDIKPIVGTPTCMHAHIGFLASGHIHMTFPDGCTRDYIAPQVIVIEPDHDGKVIGNEPAVVIEFDFEGETAAKCGLPDKHRH